MKGITSNPVSLLAIFVGVWWLCSFAVDFMSRKVLLEKGEESITYKGLMTEFSTLLWVEVTTLQNIIAALLSILAMKFLKFSLWPLNVSNHKKVVFMAAIGHFLGTLATNATYTLVASDIAVLIQASQPLFTFLFMTKGFVLLDLSKLLSIMLILIGMGALQMDSTSLVFNIWGVLAASVSSLAFAGRNVLLKDGIENWDNTLEKFTIVSSLSALFSLIIWILKVVATGTSFTTTPFGNGVLACIIYPVNTFSSFKVLEQVTVVTRAIVTVWIKLFSNLERFLTFTPVNFSLHIILCQCVFLLGLYMHRYSNLHTRNINIWIAFKLLSIFSVFVGFRPQKFFGQSSCRGTATKLWHFVDDAIETARYSMTL